MSGLRRLDERVEQPLRHRRLRRLTLEDPRAQSTWGSLDAEEQWTAWTAATAGTGRAAVDDPRLLLALLDSAEARTHRVAIVLGVLGLLALLVGLVVLAFGASDVAGALLLPLGGYAVGGLVGMTIRLRRLRNRRLQVLGPLLDDVRPHDGGA